MCSKPLEYVFIGLLGKPIGLKGWCRVNEIGPTIQQLKTPSEVFIDQGDHMMRVCIIGLRGSGQTAQICIEGFDTKEKIELLRNKQLFTTRDKLVSLPESTHYHLELIGMNVVSSQTKKVLGVVQSVHNYSTVDGLSIERTNGNIVLLPMTKEVLLSIDKKERIIVIADELVSELLL